MSQTVAHLLTPYLFLTGSWIHSQLLHNHQFRPIAISQWTENREVFPFDPVYDLSRESRGISRPLFLFTKYFLGAYPSKPYREIFEKERVGIVHAHLGWEAARTVNVSGGKLPFVCSFYGRDATLLARNPYWKRLYKRLFAKADRVLAEGHFMASTLESIGAPADKIRVVHLGVDPAEFEFRERSIAEPNRAVNGLITASFREKKGIPYGLEAMAKITERHPQFRLRIIGDGPMRAEIEARCAQPDLAGKVKLLGYQPYPVYMEELGKADFLIAPSVTAHDGDSEGGAPVCLIDAQARGLPIVATTHCDIPEITQPEHSAFLAPERDVDALAARLDELLSSPEKWPEMGRAGRAHIEAEFDIHRQVAKMNEIYRELI